MYGMEYYRIVTLLQWLFVISSCYPNIDAVTTHSLRERQRLELKCIISKKTKLLSWYKENGSSRTLIATQDKKHKWKANIHPRWKHDIALGVHKSTATLYIARVVFPKHNGVYVCKQGPQSRTWSVLITVPPTGLKLWKRDENTKKSTQITKTLELTEGKVTTIYATITRANPPTVVYTWTIGRYVKYTGRILKLANVRGIWTNSLLMCTASNKYHHVSSMIRIKVKYPPTVKIWTEEISTTKRKLSCLIKPGFPVKTSVHWIHSVNYTTVREIEAKVNQNKAVLFVDIMDFYQNGVYTCEAENGLDPAEKSTTVHHKVSMFTKVSPSQSLLVNETLSLVASFVSFDGQARVRWVKQSTGRITTFTHKITQRDAEIEFFGTKVSLHIYLTQFRIKNAKAQDSGNYTCQVTIHSNPEHGGISTPIFKMQKTISVTVSEKETTKSSEKETTKSSEKETTKSNEKETTKSSEKETTKSSDGSKQSVNVPLLAGIVGGVGGLAIFVTCVVFIVLCRTGKRPYCCRKKKDKNEYQETVVSPRNNALTLNNQVYGKGKDVDSDSVYEELEDSYIYADNYTKLNVKDANDNPKMETNAAKMTRHNVSKAMYDNTAASNILPTAPTYEETQNEYVYFEEENEPKQPQIANDNTYFVLEQTNDNKEATSDNYGPGMEPYYLQIHP